jgi:hypothetical protein
VINRDELVEAASALGLTPSESEMDALFRQYDVESNDELSLGEFDQFVRDQVVLIFPDMIDALVGGGCLTWWSWWWWWHLAGIIIRFVDLAVHMIIVTCHSAPYLLESSSHAHDTFLSHCI